MKLDEAIKHAEEVAEEHESDLKVYENLGKDRELFKKEENNCKECGEQHRQLAEWLKELKQLREQTQEPCEDCVSRKRLMDNYNGVKTPVGYRKVVDLEVIKNMPSVTPTAKWIPVSEKMPNPGEYNGDVDRYYLVQNEYDDMLVARYAKKGYWEQIYQFGEIKEKIVAWRPLPEPYQAESESEE